MRLSSPCLGGDVGAEVADHIAALVDVAGGPSAALAVHEVRPDATHPEQRRGINVGLIKLTCVLLDQFAHHLEVAEFLERDALQHVPDRCVCNMKRLHPVL